MLHRINVTHLNINEYFIKKYNLYVFFKIIINLNILLLENYFLYKIFK